MEFVALDQMKRSEEDTIFEVFLDLVLGFFEMEAIHYIILYSFMRQQRNCQSLVA